MVMWEKVLLGIVAVAILFLFWPGAKQALEQSRKVENPDWNAALLPIGIVVLFVVILVISSKG